MSTNRLSLLVLLLYLLLGTNTVYGSDSCRTIFEGRRSTWADVLAKPVENYRREERQSTSAAIHLEIESPISPQEKADLDVMEHIQKSVDYGNYETAEATLRSVTRSPLFRLFLRSVEIPPRGNPIEVLKRFRIYASRQLRSPSRLRSMQEAALEESLHEHGAQASVMKGRAHLVEISGINKERTLLKASKSTTSEQNRLLADQIDVFFIHSTHSLKTQPKFPIMSSRLLEWLGLGKGANSAEFNRDFMRTDTNVYFRVGFKRKTEQRMEGLRIYGDTDLVLDSNYARENGMVSHYVMSPWDLRSFGEIHFPERYPKLPYNRLTEYNESTRPELTEIKGQLHLGDYTVDDFVAIIKHQLSRSLESLEATDPAKYSRYRSIIETGVPTYTPEARALIEARISERNKNDPRRASEAIARLDQPSPDRFYEMLNELVFSPLGISPTWELKVPVAVPEGKVRVVTAG